MPDSLALTDENGKKLKVRGRYKKVKSKRFKDICAEADAGNKYNLDDEIEVIRGLVARIISILDPDEEDLQTDSLYLQLTAGKKFDAPVAARICSAVDAQGSSKDMVLILRELRECLKQASEFEHMIPHDKLRTFLGEVFRIIKIEVKDDLLVDRIGAKVRLLNF